MAAAAAEAQPRQSKTPSEAERLSSTCAHIERAWICKVRPIVAMAPLRALTVADVIRAIVLIEDRGVDLATHSWIDVSMPRYTNARRLAIEVACPALVVARFNDAVMFVNTKDVGQLMVLCGSDGAARARLQVNRFTPVRFESRW